MGFGSPRRHRQASRLLQAAIVAVLVAGVARGSVGVAVNAAVALAVTALPAVLERDPRVALDPRLTLYLTAAVLLHAVGMLGLYDDVWWWDHLTHTLSATVVAAAGYAGARALDRHSPALALPREFMAAFVLLLTLALGVAWEVLEFAARGLADALGMEPVLVQYGLEDTVMDLVFDAVGALLVAAFATQRLGGLVDAASALLDRVY